MGADLCSHRIFIVVAEVISEQQTNCFTWTGGDDIAKMTYPRSHLKLYNCAVSKHHMQQDCLRLHGTARHPEAKTACCASSRVSNPAPPAQVEFPYRMFATLVPHKSTGSEPCLERESMAESCTAAFGYITKGCVSCSYQTFGSKVLLGVLVTPESSEKGFYAWTS